ncbi:MAG: hypothetical protein EZS28_008600 [Streblomastix strix]|uniref:Uncharacterized protein n=1 Tax=Streblomastix strix TaxID=222440 RepID=A0A5J4WM19_9EUKA|nr:MAG: hypothetical protein EZS28_008600 [Streblomastix strix]
MLIGIIPNNTHAYQQRRKIIRTNIQGVSTVAFDPIISSGIVRFEGFLEKHPNQFIIGIADSSAVFGSNEFPDEGGKVKFIILEIGLEEIVELKKINLLQWKLT